MARSITTAVRRVLEAERSGDPILVFVVIDHANLDKPIRLVRDTIDFMKGGNRFYASQFDVTILDDGEDQPRASLSFPNITGAVSEALEAITTSPTVQMDLHLGSDWNTSVDPRSPIGNPSPFYTATLMEFERITLTAVEASGELIVRDYGAEPYGRLATKGRFPGLHRGP